MKRGIKKTVAACCIALMLLSGCTKSAGTESADTKDTVSDLTEQEENLSDIDEDTAEDTDGMFTDRDKEVGYDENVQRYSCRMMAAAVTVNLFP